MNFSRLVEEARAGREEAVQKLYAQYSGRVRAAVRRRLNPVLRRKFDSMDIVQSVFAEVLRDLPRLEDRGEVAFRHWLYIKTTNKVHSKLRRYIGTRARRVEAGLDSGVDLPTPESGPPSNLVRRENSEQAAAALDGLDAESRELVRMRLDEGLSFPKIAERLGLASSDAARKRYARVIGRLRRSWAK